MRGVGGGRDVVGRLRRDRAGCDVDGSPAGFGANGAGQGGGADSVGYANAVHGDSGGRGDDGGSGRQQDGVAAVGGWCGRRGECGRYAFADGGPNGYTFANCDPD